MREVLIGIVCLVIGLVGGFFAANALNRDSLTSSSITSSDASVTVPSDGMESDVTSTLTAADSDPQNFPAQMRAGDMYAQIGRFEKAVEFYKRGVLINPSNFQANVTLANALFDSQQFEEAEQYYARALQIQPDNADARTDLGATFVERSSPDYQRAIAEFEQVQSSNPQHLPSLYYLGIATLRKGDKDRAKKVLAELERKGPQSELVGRLRQNIEAAEVTR
ncbi:MAG TPA: tetratricopeptide repeat protein [Pyrinomonadaceae bacterium]